MSDYTQFTTRDLKPLAQARAKERSEASSWIATAPKAALVAYLEGGAPPAALPIPSAPNPSAQAEAIAAAIGAALAQASVAQGVDVDSVNALLEPVAARVAALEEREAPRPIVVAGRSAPKAQGIQRSHKCLEETLEALLDHRVVYLHGPAGTGKTTLIAQAAGALGLDHGGLSCTAGMSESHIMGRSTPDARYLPSEFVSLYENGGVFLFDEIDAADANVLLLVNRATANGHFSVPVRSENPSAKRHAENYIACAGNTRGDAYGGAYAARTRLDLAFLDRFTGAAIEVGYDTDLERDIASALPAQVPSALWSMRANVDAAALERVVSTRAFVACARMAHRFDTDTRAGREALVGRVTALWSAEDRAVAMAGVTF